MNQCKERRLQTTSLYINIRELQFPESCYSFSLRVLQENIAWSFLILDLPSLAFVPYHDEIYMYVMIFLKYTLSLNCINPIKF